MASNLWLLPVLCVLGGVVLSVGTIAVDRWFDYTLIPRWITGGLFPLDGGRALTSLR